MPLHLIPESSTLVKSPMFQDELFLIKSISKSIPINWKLYVKEHPDMLGERPISFYNEVRRIYNVRLIKLDYYNDSRPLILKSKGVITIAGSTALEAAMLGKPSVVFAHSFHNIINSIHVVKSINELEMIFYKFKNYEENASDKKSCAAYLKTTKDFGRQIDIKKTIRLSAQKIAKNDLSLNEEKELNKLIDGLYSLYSDIIKIN